MYPDYKPYDDDDVPDDFILPPGNVERGKRIFKKHCGQCHSIQKNNRVGTGSTLLGPNLYGIYGRAAGIGPRMSMYQSSAGMTMSGILWTDLTLMRYTKNPRAFSDSPIYMNFRGIDSWDDRVDLIWYLKQVSEDEVKEGLQEWEVPEGWKESLQKRADSFSRSAQRIKSRFGGSDESNSGENP